MQHFNKLLLSTLLSLLVVPLLSIQGTIHLETFTGQAIVPYVKDITTLSLIIYKEYPYLYDGTEEDYLPAIEHYSHSEKGIACVLFDDTKPIGVAIGMPISEMREKYQQPFLHARPEENPDEIFYLGELLLLKEYRGQGFGKQMYLELERLVIEENFKKICFCKSNEDDPDPSIMPENYRPLDEFWKKLEFERCDVSVSVYWKNIFETDESPHELVYWIKSIAKPSHEPAGMHSSCNIFQKK